MNVPSQNLDFSQTLSKGTDLLKAALVPYAIVSLAIGLIGSIALVILLAAIVGPVVGLVSGSGWFAQLVAGVLSVMVWSLIAVPVVLVISAIGGGGLIAMLDETARTGATTIDTASSAAQEQASGMVSTAFFLALWGAVISIGCAITGIGFLLLPFVAAYFFIHWSLAFIVTYVEGESGMAALSRSKELVGPVFWTVFGVLVVVGLVAGIGGAIVLAILGGIPIIGQILGFGVAIFAGTVSFAYMYTMYNTLTQGSGPRPNVTAALPETDPYA